MRNLSRPAHGPRLRHAPLGVACAALCFAVLFHVCANLPAGAADGIRVSDVILFGDMDCFRIETPSATYLYGKRGAGLAGLVDPDGHDWISYHPDGKALGEYRGLPKCGQPVKFFHCGYGFGQYTNDNPFLSTVTLRESGHVRIHSETRRRDAVCDWDFHPTHATLSLTRCGTNGYWFLYEGTPGGTLDAAEDFVVRPGGRRTLLSEPWTDVVPWVCFGAKESAFGLVLANHQTNSPVDSYVSWPYKPEPDGGLNQMTVFGFGRRGWQDPKQHDPALRQLPARFSVALTRGTDRDTIERTLKALTP